MPQLSNADLLTGDVAYEGRIRDTYDMSTFVGFNADPSNILVFGRGLAQGITDQALTYPVDATSTLKGISVAVDTFERRAGITQDVDGNMGYPINGVYSFPVTYLTRGIIAVYFSTPMQIDQTPFWVFNPDAAVLGERKGHFRNNANTGKATQLTNCRVLQTMLSAGVGYLSINRN